MVAFLSAYPAMTWRMMNTVTAVVIMNVTVATSDLGESRASPHTPCPEVHPEPRTTPIPTMKPPTASAQFDTGIVIAGIAPVAA